MADNLYRVTITKDGQVSTRDFSEEDYNAKALPFLQSNYTPDQYSVVNLQTSSEEDVQEDGDYLVTISKDGMSQSKSYSGRELIGGKLEKIRQAAPGSYSLQKTTRVNDYIGMKLDESVSRMRQAEQNVNAAADYYNPKKIFDSKIYTDPIGAYVDAAEYHGMTTDAETLEQEHQAMMEEINLHAERYANQQALSETESELADINARLSVFEEHEKAMRRSMSEGGVSLDYEDQKFLLENAEEYERLKKRRDELVELQRSNPLYQEIEKNLGLNADDVINAAQPILSAAAIAANTEIEQYDPDLYAKSVEKAGTEPQVWQAAKYFADQAKKTLGASYSDDNGFGAFLKGHADTFSDYDFWMMGLNSIASHFQVKDVFEKIAGKVKNYSDNELTDQALDEILTDGEKALLKSFVTLSHAQAIRELNTHNMYGSGATSAESIGFMAQFIISGGIVKGAASAAEKTFAKYLTKLVNKSARSMVAKGISRGATAAVMNTVRLGGEGIEAVVMPLAKAVPMTLLQTGLYKDFATKMTERDEYGNLAYGNVDEDGKLDYEYGRLIKHSFRDAGLEVWSEMALSPVLNVFGKAMGVAGKGIMGSLEKKGISSAKAMMMKTKLDDIGKFLHSREAMKILVDAGFDGYFEEIGEEILGAWVSKMWDEKSWERFWEKDNLVSMAVAFAPMSVLGGGMSMANYAKRSMKYAESEPVIRQMLQPYIESGRYTQEEIDEMFNRKCNTMEDVGNKISSLIAPIVEHGQMDEETFEALFKFVDATAQKEIAEKLTQRVTSDRRAWTDATLRDELNGRTYTSSGAEGEMVSYTEDENGNRMYFLTDQEQDGKFLSFDSEGGDVKFRTPEGEMKTMGKDQFLDAEYEAARRRAENKRMAEEKAAKNASVAERLQAGQEFVMYNDQEGEKVKYIFDHWEGENAAVVRMVNGKPVMELIPLQKIANAFGIDVSVLTDAEREQASIEESRRKDSLVRMGNRAKGFQVRLGGYEGRLQRVFVKSTEDGAQRLMASILQKDGSVVETEVTEKEIDQLSSSVPADSRGERNKARKEADKKRKEANSAYSAAKKRFTSQDGKVREGEFLDADPEGFCRYSDEKYGKDDTNETLRAAIAKAQKALAKAMDERQAESDPDRKQDLRKAYEAAKAKVDKLVELLGRRTQDESSRGALDPEAARKKHDELLARGLSEEEIAQLAQTAIDEAQAAISAIPKPEVTTDVDSYLRAKKAYADAVAKQQAKIDFWKSVMNAPSQETLDRTSTIARYRREAARIAGELRQAKTPELRRRLEREQETLALNSIRDLARFNDQSKHVAELERELGKDAPVPVDVVTYANILDTMRKNGLSEATIAKMQRKLAKSQLAYLLGRPNTIGGIHCAGKVYIFAEGNPTTSRARITYAHEAQHEINSRDPHAMNSVLALARNDRETLRGMLKSIIGESGFRGYEDADAQELADEIVAYTMQEAVNGGSLAERLKAKGVSEELTNLISKEYDRQQRNAEGRDKRSRDRALNDGGTHSGELRTDAGAEGAASRDEQLGSPRSSDGRGDSGRSEESIARDAATAAGGGIDLGGGEAPIRQSISAGAEGSGLEVRMDDGKGNVAFVHPDGRVFTGKTPITADDLIALDNTPLSYMVADAQELGTITSKQAVEIFQKYADMLNASLVKGLKENGGFENLSSQWQWVGETVYKTVATNGDKQYSYSLDITRVCKKNEAVIMTIAETQRRLGYGITPGQIMDIYLASKEEGYQVPCPVCYVFSRYINNGKYATIMINGQKKFGDLLVDPSTLTDEQKAEKIAMWQGLLEEAKENNKKNAKAITAAKKELKFDLEQIDKLGQAIMRGELTGKAAENARRRIQVLDGKYRAALDVVAQSSLDSWIKQFAIHEVGGEWQLYDDTFQGFPEEIALDLRETATAMTKYPAIQRYRNSRGAGAGKEITFAANNDFGEVAMMLGSMDTPNYYKMAAQAEDEKTRAEYRAKAQKRFLAAHKYAQQQSLRGGQRMWSWSDNIEKLAPDVFMNLLQLQMLGGALQSYSKQLEGIKLVASMGGYVNGSLMGKGIGYREVAPADVENLGGRLFVKGGDFNAVADNGRPIVLKAPVFEQDGRYYTLEFDDVVGIDAYGRADEKDGHHLKGLFELNEAYDKAGNILVGMNDLHIRTAMADDRVYFIIPWHASGNDVHILRQMLGYLEVDLHDFNPKDYTTVQEEKKVDKVSPALQKFWESHRNEADFRCGIEGGIPSGTKGELSEQQRHYKELRDAIFIGVKRERKDADGNTIMKDGAPVMETVSLEEYSTAWMQEVLNDEFLSQAYAKVRKFVDAQEMTNADTGFIYPYEYWDEQSTYWTADVNGARYLEYCRRLGYKPKFCGTLGGKKDFGNFADDKGYWKLLIDRRMYDTRGNFQDLTPVTSENFTPDLVDPEKTAKEFYVTKVADEDAARKVADKVIEKEVGYTGTMPAVNYDKGFTLDNAVDNFNLAVKDFRAFEKTMSKAEKEELRLSVTPAADNALTDDQRRALDLIGEKPEDIRASVSADVDWESLERNGEDVSADRMKEVFGIESTYIGKDARNNAYDSLLKVAKTFGVSPNALSFGGTLGIRYYTGRANAVAFFSLTDPVSWNVYRGRQMKITGINDPYVFAHEWFHALDNFLTQTEEDRKKGEIKGNFTSAGFEATREAVTEAIRDIERAMKKSGFNARIKEVSDDVFGSYYSNRSYWKSKIEKNARAVEMLFAMRNGMLESLQEDGNKMYPTVEEMKTIAPAIDKFFDTLEEKTDEQGYKILFSYSPEVAEEMESVKAVARVNGTFMKAPNGKDTKLSEDQWALVRTSNFKDWFGDWENDPENASKVVDKETGEPMVVYHGTTLEYENGEPWYEFYQDTHFGTAEQAKEIAERGKMPKVYEVFLNARNLKEVEDFNLDELRKSGATDAEYWGGVMDKAESEGFDGLKYTNKYEAKESNGTSYMVRNPNQIKSATDNNGEFNPEDPDIRFSVTSEQDADYMAAVEAGDMEKAQAMVKDAAQKAGAIADEKDSPIVLYHGTPHFGFTEFIPGKGDAIWTSSEKRVSANYAGNDYASPRDIRKRIKGDISTESIIADMESLTGQKWRKATNEERQSVIDNTEKKAVDICLGFISDGTYELPGNEEEKAEIYNSISWIKNLFWELAEAKSNEWSNEERYKYIKSSLEHYNEERIKLREYKDKYFSEIKGDAKTEIDFLLHWKVGDVAIDAMYGYLASAKPGDALTTDYEGSTIVSPKELRKTIERSKNIGAYKLFGFGNNILEVDCKEKNWFSLDFNGMTSTDEIAVWAKKNGYDGVHFKSVYDYGELADDYCFFESSSVKSADTYTYDDNGKVIPLSERFNSRSEDIRYSITPEQDAAYAKAFTEGNDEEASRMVREAFKAAYPNTKVTDENGNPKTMYHGTTKFGFTKFDKEKVDDGRSFFFTDNVRVARTYSSSPYAKEIKDSANEDRETLYKESMEILSDAATYAYNKIPYTFDYDYLRETLEDFWGKLVDDELSKERLDDQLYEWFDEAIIDHYSWQSEDYDEYDDWEESEEAEAIFTVVNETIAKVIEAGDHLKGSNGNYQVYLDLENPLVIDAKGADWRRIPYLKPEGVRTRVVAESAQEQGYDGVIIYNVKDSGDYEGERGPSNIAVAFNPSAIKSADTYTYDNNGRLIPLSERFNPSNEDIRYSVTPEMESEYDEAVKSGNTEKAQELVDEVAAKSGYGIKAAHYTDSEFTVFDKDKLGSNTGWEDASLGFHFLPEGTDEKQGRQFGSRKMDVYIKGNNILDIRTLTPELEKLIQEDIDAYDSDMTVDEAYQEMIFDGPSVKEFLRDIDVFSKGYDAVVANFGAGISEYIVPDASQIKSAEAVTYDSEGNVIPLAERFNDQNEDLRFYITPEMDADFRKAYEEGDTENASRMVKEAFKAKYPNTKIVDENGNPLVVYHGSLSTFNVFDPRTLGLSTDADSSKQGFFFTPDKALGDWFKEISEVRGDEGFDIFQENLLNFIERNLTDEMAEEYVSDNYEAMTGDELDADGKWKKTAKYTAIKLLREKMDEGWFSETEQLLKDIKKMNLDPTKTYEVFLNIENPVVDTEFRDYTIDNGADTRMTDIIARAKENGNDGVVFTDIKEQGGRSPQYVVFDNKKIKSAEPFTFDDNGELIPLSERFNESNPDLRFSYTKENPTAVETIAAEGIDKFLEGKDTDKLEWFAIVWSDPTIDKAMQAEHVKRSLDNGGRFDLDTEEMLIAMASKDSLTPAEQALADAAAKELSKIAGEEVTANDVLWTLYSEAHANDESLMERKRNLEVRRNLGKRAKVGPEMTPEEGFNQAMEVKDELTEAYDKMKDDSLSKYNEQLDEAAYLQDIAEAMNSRRDYDRLSVGKMVNLLRKMISAGTLDNASRFTVKRILAVVRKTNGMRNITSVANKLYDVLLDSCTKNMETLYGKVIGRKAAKVDSKGVSAQGALDVDGQKIMDAYKRNVISARDEQGNEVAISTEEINKKILELTDKLTSKNPAVVREAELEIAGLNLARRYADDVQSVRVELKRLAAEDKEKKEEVATGKIDKKSYREFRKEYSRTVRALKSSRYAALTELTRDLLDIADASHSRALDFVKAQKEHVAEIHHNCNSEMEGKSANQYNPNDGFLAKMTNNPVVGFFLSPLATFDQMLRMIGRKSVNGEGYLWNRFMRGWVRATGNEFDGVRECFRELDAKVSEVFGKVSKKGKAKMRWSDLYSVERRMPKVEVSLYQDPRHVDKDGNRVKDTIKLSQGNLLYILLADQMTDGRMKLRAMGIDEEQIEAIRAQMDPRFIKLAEWLVKDFLPSRREKYNAVHERMFGAPMAKVDNYFPLKINKRSRTQAIDVTTADRNPSTASTVTGSIIKRVHNITAIDIKTDAFSAVIEHVQNMERWAAFAEFNRDVNTMLSYNDFKNQVINENSIYGSGQELWDKFCKVCMIATGFYKAEGNSEVDRYIMKMAKGATAAAISLRTFTAIKQLLSYPAYFAEARPDLLLFSTLSTMTYGKGVKWAMENLPMFRKRWESRQAGDHILSTSENWKSRVMESAARVGMTMNASVDALTIAMGAYAIYLTKKKRYLKMGFKEADAEQRAKEDAMILYNETQQSNEAAFLSTIQSDRSVATASLTVFRNSSMGYTRQLVDAVRNLSRRMGKGYAKESKAYMAKQLEREGLSKDAAEKAAKSMYRRQGFKDAVRVGVFGWLMQFAWNMGSDLVYLLFGDDDDKRKEMREDCAVHALFGGIEGLALGGSLSEAFNSLAKGEGFKLDLTLLPFFSNLETLVSEFSRDEVTAINDMVNLAVQMGLGVNPQTIEDMVLAVTDACFGDPKTGREALFLALRILAVPQSQLDELYIDEIQAKAIDAKEMTVEEIARRYAEYKLRRGALATAWLYDDASRAEKMEKYMKRLEGKLSDRDNLDEVGRRINDLAEQGKEMENRVNGLRERQRDGDADADRQLMEIYSSEDYGRLLRFKEESKTIKAEVDKAMQADNVDEMTSHLAKANELRKRLYDNYEPAEGSDAYYLDRFSQYTRGLLPYMAEMDKKYQKQYMDAHPEFQAAMAKYQEALDSASEDAQTNREKILKLEEERKGYKHPYKKNKYLPQYENRVKEIRAEIKELKAAGTTPAAVRKKLMKKYEIGPETYMPKDILESPAYKLYLEMRSLGSVSGNAFNFKAVDDYDRMINESTNPRTKDNYETRKMERKVLLGLEMQNILDGKPAEE